MKKKGHSIRDPTLFNPSKKENRKRGGRYKKRGCWDIMTDLSAEFGAVVNSGEKQDDSFLRAG